MPVERGVDGATMPAPEQLPEVLQPLVRRNAVELRNTQFGADAERLIARINEVLNRPGVGTKRKRMVIAGILASVLIIAITSFLLARWVPRRIPEKR
jgi:hypothetical protein